MTFHYETVLTLEINGAEFDIPVNIQWYAEKPEPEVGFNGSVCIEDVTLLCREHDFYYRDYIDEYVEKNKDRLLEDAMKSQADYENYLLEEKYQREKELKYDS